MLFTSSALSAARQAGGWELNWLSAYSACMRLWLRSACSPHAGQGSEPRGIALCFLPTRFIPRSQRPSVPACHPLVAAVQAHTRPGALPVTPFWPPYPKSLEGRGIMGPTQNWPLLMLFHRVLECPNWKGLGRAASPAPHADGSQVHKSELSFRLSDTLGSPGLELGTLGPQSSIQLLLQLVTEKPQRAKKPFSIEPTSHCRDS